MLIKGFTASNRSNWCAPSPYSIPISWLGARLLYLHNHAMHLISVSFYRLNTSGFKQLTSDLERHLLKMEQCYDLMTSQATVRKRHEQFYARRWLLLTQWAWCEKVNFINRKRWNTHSYKLSDNITLSGGGDLVSSETMWLFEIFSCESDTECAAFRFRHNFCRRTFWLQPNHFFHVFRMEADVEGSSSCDSEESGGSSEAVQCDRP